MKFRYSNLLFFVLSLPFMAILLLVLFFPNLSTKITIGSRNYGDLYQMAKVVQFKQKIDTTIPIKSVNSLNNSEIIVMGDSFFNVSPGYPIFADQLSEKLQMAVHNYNIQGAGELWRQTNPVKYLNRSPNPFIDKKRRILILESVDRGIAMRYLSIQDLAEKINSSLNVTPKMCKINAQDKKAPLLSVDVIQLDETEIMISGWTSDDEANGVSSLQIFSNGSLLASTSSFLKRPDVAEYLHNADLIDSGFDLIIPHNLKVGKHQIRIVSTDCSGNSTEFSKALSVFPSFKMLENFSIRLNVLLDDWQAYIRQKLKSATYLAAENILIRSIAELRATARFVIFGEISPLTPKYTLDYPRLFYVDEVNFVKDRTDNAEIEKIAKNLLSISETLQNEFQIDLVFVPMPNKYTVHLARSGEANYFLTQLISELTKLGIHTVDLYSPFINSNQELFFSSDTHLNSHGMQLVTQTVTEYLINNSLISNTDINQN